jgi:RNA polymerase sigma factor (sigma-70 family)
LKKVRLATGNSDDRLEWELRCLAEIQRGNRRAFGELYAEFAAPLYAQILLPRLGNPAAAEEALAETFRAALESLGTYRSQGTSLFGWLARIAANKATDVHRHRLRTGKALASFDALLAPLREPGHEMERRLDQGRLRVAVDAALGDLSPRYRRTIELRMLEDLRRVECAQRMQISVGAFDVLLLRALRAFRQAFIARHGEKWEEP